MAAHSAALVSEELILRELRRAGGLRRSCSGRWSGWEFVRLQLQHRLALVRELAKARVRGACGWVGVVPGQGEARLAAGPVGWGGKSGCCCGVAVADVGCLAARVTLLAMVKW